MVWKLWRLGLRESNTSWECTKVCWKIIKEIARKVLLLENRGREWETIFVI